MGVELKNLLVLHALIILHRYNVTALYYHSDWLLSAFANLRKATISVVISVRLSVCMEQLGSYWTDFHEI
jgi:hypothetical protein